MTTTTAALALADAAREVGLEVFPTRSGWTLSTPEDTPDGEEVVIHLRLLPDEGEGPVWRGERAYSGRWAEAAVLATVLGALVD